MSWVPFIKREPGVVYKCNRCLDYGGVLDDEAVDHEGLPLMEACDHGENDALDL